MKKMKRWLALVLAIALVSTNAIYQLGTHMSASESSQDTSVSEEQPQQEEQAADSQTQDTTEHTDSGQASVQEVTPDQSATATTQQAADVQQAADAQQTEAEQTDVAKTIAVKIQKSDVDGGTVKVVNADGSKSDVTYDGNNQYAKEVTEGESFGFEVTAKDGYQVEQVTDQNGTVIQPASVNGNVSTYNVTDIRSEKVFSVTYNKVETQTEEKKDEKTENKAEDATATEETEDQNDADTQVTSTAGETHEDTATEKWITVGKSVTLSSENYQYGNYSHEWSIDEDSQEIVSKSGWGSSITVTGLKEGTATVKDKVTWTTGVFWQQEHEDTITYTVHVLAKKSATGITITGANEVTQFKNINLTYTLTPAGAEGTVQWSSSNEDILTVDSSGKVTGLRRGQATVTANVYSGQSLLCSATKIIQVVEDTTVAGEFATVYYLLDPTKDANSNDTGNWGPAYGTAKVNVTGATWTGGKNCFDNVDQRVVSWPNGTNVVTRNSEAWNQIFNNYKSSVEQQLGMRITKDDVVSITLRPAKISRNNYSNPDKHLDCNVDVNCKSVSIVHYYLLDKSSDPNSTEYVHQGSKSYINGNKTNPETVTGKSFPTTKKGTDGATYTFSGWYTDQELTQPATFPYTVNSNVNFYAKYVAGRQVIYNLNGGSFSNGSALTEKHNEGENVVVKSEPTRKGYKFTGWTVEGLDGVSSINSGASFQMPNNNVTITANWKEQKIEDFITLTPTDVTEVYNGEAHAAGTAKVAGKAEGADISDLKIEYQKADGSWTENPADITATNVSDSKTVKVRVSSEGKYTGTLTVEEKLTITRRPVTVTANSCQKTFGEADPEFTAKVEGTLGNDKVDYKLSRKSGEDVGTYTITSTGDEKQGNYKVTYKPGTLTIVAAQRTTELSVTSYNGVYDAKKHTIAVNGTVAGDKVEYSYDGGKTWVADLKEYKNVTDGSVAIQVKVTNTNYTPSETILNGTVTITPFPLIVKADDKSKVFGEKDPKLTATETSGVEGKEKPDNQKIERTMTREAGENVGNYKITASGETTQGNYTVTYKPGTLTITAGSRPEDRQLSVTSYNGVYDANEHTITVNNVLDGDVVKYSYDNGATWTTDLTQYTDVTNTTIKVRVTNANYDPNPVELEGTVTITPKPVTVTARSYSKTFGAADPTFEADTAGTLNGDKITYDISRETGEDVGTYTITPAGEAVQGNYNVTYATGTLTITASDREKAVEVTSYNGVYDAKNHTIEVKNLVDGDQVEYSYDNGTTWTTDLTKYKDVTDTTILVKVTNANYAEVPQLTGTVTITRFPLVVKAEDKSKVFGEKDPKLTATETSGVEGKAKPDKQEITYDLSRTAGENVGEYPITVKGEAVQGNYTVTYEPGTLKITKAERTKDIEVVNYKDVYDAGNHTIEVKNLVDGDKVEYSYDGGKTWTTDLKQYKNVTAEVKIQVKVTNDNYKPVDTKTGTVEITRRPVTVTANSYQKTFGETDPEFTAKVEGTLGNDKVDYKLSRKSGEDVGTYTITSTGDEKQGNYKVTYKPGTLTIVAAQRTTELSVTSYNGVYDAKKHTIAVNGTVAGDKVEYSYDGGKTWVADLKEYKNVTDGSVAIQVKVTNTNYTPSETILNGTVTITPFPLIVKADDKSKVFGEKDPKLTATETSGVEGKEKPDNQKIERTMTREAGENVGNYKITASGETTQGNYTVTYKPGTLTITAGSRPEDRQLSVTSYNGVYDANEHTITVNNVLDGDVVKYSYDNGATWTTDLTQYTDVTNTTIKVRVTNANYDPNPVELEGTVTITPKPVTVTARSYSKTFGAADPTFEADTAGTLNGDKITYDISRETGEDVGTYTITPAGEAVQGNYNVTYATGTLTITASDREKAVEVTSYNGVYDAKNHTIEVKNLVDGDQVEYSYDNGTTWTTDLTKYKDVTDTTILVKVTNANYAEVPQLTGTVTITRFPLVVKAEDKSKVFGEKDPKLTATETSGVEGKAKPDKQEITYDLSRTAGENVGEYPITATGEAVQGNYTVTYEPGKLTITKAERAKDIEVVNYKNVYDAGNHTIEVKNLVDGDKVEYSYDGGKTWTTDLKQYKDVTAEVKIQVKVTNDNYKPVDTKTGTVEITRRPVTVTANSYQKTFGEADLEFTAKVEGTLGNDKVDYKLSREKGEDVGTYTITPTGDEKQGNYKVTYKPGTLTIVAAQRTTELSVTSYNGVYDAKKHTIEVNGTVAGDKVEYSYNGITWSDKLKEYTDVIDTEIKVRVTNSNYEPAVTDNLYGRVTITSRPISITGEGWDTDQLYTGKAYKTDKFEWENANKANTRGLVDGQSVNTTYKLEGTNVSEKPYTGVFTAVQIVSADNKDVTNNYTVKTNPGTLKIVAQSINPGPNPEKPDPSYDGIKIDSPSDVEYDGQAHKWSPTVTDKNGNALTEGTDYEVSYDKDDFTDVKTITVTITGKGNYTGTVTRVYNILAAPLIIRTEKAEKTYDGKPLTNENMTIEGLKNGEVVVHKTTGSQTEVGNSDNTYELDWKSKETTAKESNYIIKEVSLGKLVVKETEDEIVVTTTGGTFTYDGQPHGATVEVSELPEGYTLQTAESDATATDVTTEAVTADADRLVIVNAAGVDVTANLKITRVTGEIVVNPATVTVTTPNASKVYDGTPLTAAGTITGLVNGETVSFATTGTITNVGTATNSYSLVWDQTAKETNYTVSENLGTLTVTAPTNNNPSVTPTPPATPSDNPGVLDRVVDTIKDVAADVQEVFSSDDGDVPLANQNLDEHKCCILHFLIMLLTAILYGFFTHNMKKRQKKNFELREELDTELVKRGLPTSKEQKNS